MANIYIALLFGRRHFFRYPSCQTVKILGKQRSTKKPACKRAGAPQAPELIAPEQAGAAHNLANCILCEIFIGCLSMISSLLYRFHMIRKKSCPICQNVREWQTEDSKTRQPEQCRTEQLNILNLCCKCNETRQTPKQITRLYM